MDHERQETWATFQAACLACQACDLARTRRHVVVYRGAMEAPLLFLGEGPGAEEDAQGEPFVGRSGRLLDTVLQAIDIPARLYHVANIVKCRPPGNRVPTPEEVKACAPLLARQVALVKPRLVVLLGATAYHQFTGESDPIGRVRGHWHRHGDMDVMPTFHPAYVLRDPRQRIHLYHDLALVKARLDALEDA